MYLIKDKRDNTEFKGDLDQVKEYFKYDLKNVNEEDIEHFKKENIFIENALDIADLWEILTYQMDGMAFPFTYEEV